MGLTTQAYRVHVAEQKESAPFHHIKSGRFLQPQQQVILRELTEEEMSRPHEQLPSLPTYRATMLLISMMEPYRYLRPCGSDDDPRYNEIRHESFVRAHHRLSYFRHPYTDDADLYDQVRDFIRECALNHYYAIYD